MVLPIPKPPRRLMWNRVMVLQCDSTDPVHLTICHTPGSPVVGRVIGVISTWLRQCDPCWSAWSWVEQTSVSSECCSMTHILREEAWSFNATTAWSPLAAGATAYWIQDCSACLPVSSQTSSGISVFQATECEEPTIKATTTIVVIALPSCSDIATVNCWQSCFSSCCHMTLECSLSRDVISTSSLQALKCFCHRYITGSRRITNFCTESILLKNWGCQI